MSETPTLTGRRCARCDVPIDHRDPRSRHCSPLCRGRDYEGSAVGTVKICAHCGEMFSPKTARSLYCSRTCSSRADVDKNRAEYNRRNAARRALERGARVEVFTREEIFDRDGWICQLCLTPIDCTLTGRGRFAPALDHIVPLNKGGQHTRANCWAAHSGCNARKSDRTDVVILPVLTGLGEGRVDGRSRTSA